LRNARQRAAFLTEDPIEREFLFIRLAERCYAAQQQQ
jgi:hypothetical protein